MPPRPEASDDAVAAAEERAGREAAVVDRARRREPAARRARRARLASPATAGRRHRWSCDAGLVRPRPGCVASSARARSCGITVSIADGGSGVRQLRAELAGILRESINAAQVGQRDVGHALWGCNYMTSGLLYFGKRS